MSTKNLSFFLLMLCACNKDAPEEVLTSDESLMLINDIENLPVSTLTKSKLQSKFKDHIEQLGATRSERERLDSECQDPNSAVGCLIVELCKQNCSPID